MKLQTDKVIVVNERDEWMNLASKEEAHRSGVLHRALSVFITNRRGELLLQQRAADKYHSGGLWSNSCCSHPAPNEASIAAAHRRLQEELGFDTELRPAGTLLYRAEVGNGLIEHEYDHLFEGTWDGEVTPAPEEVSSVRWVGAADLESWLQREPQQFTAWFPLLLAAWKSQAAEGAPRFLSGAEGPDTMEA